VSTTTADADTSSVVAALDIGGTKTSAALVDSSSSIVARVIGPTPAAAGAEATLDAAARLVQALSDGRVPAVGALGVGTAGVVDPGSGRILSSTDAISSWAGTDVGEGLRRRLGLSVAVDNDVHAHLLGELTSGRAVGRSCVLLVAVGTGIGGSIAVDGRMHRGRGHVAGHVGHMPSTASSGVPCSCGGADHVEAVASGPALLRAYNGQAVGRGAETADTLEEVAERAAAGRDPLAAEVISAGGTELGRLIGGLVNLLDPDLVIVTGGVSDCGPSWWTALLSAAQSGVLPPIRAASPIDRLVVKSILRADAPLLGAAQLARELAR